MEEMDLAVQAATTPVVKIWMNWMLAVFAASIIFVWKYKAARVVFGAFVLTIPIALIVFNVSKSAHLIGIAHLIVWGPLTYYLIKKVVMDSSFQKLSFFGGWIYLVVVTITISLIFDVRDIILVSMGVK